ncbi:hypothetical protein [Nostoc favosum]|uniref:Uncharacterized protein n=1 Tax=Nostoc favosum CHAB5714 TaxID=2780399 RepID=A0ABS8IFB7_9NOSO|nr:hypothetical protein [Nostoc favosum]MCC5602152.1 hypothetical protein [Nostoc favosum CHAB5714]
MRVIVTVVEKITSEAHIDIPDGLNQSAFPAAHRRPLQQWGNTHKYEHLSS